MTKVNKCETLVGGTESRWRSVPDRHVCTCGRVTRVIM